MKVNSWYSEDSIFRWVEVLQKSIFILFILRLSFNWITSPRMYCDWESIAMFLSFDTIPGLKRTGQRAWGKCQGKTRIFQVLSGYWSPAKEKPAFPDFFFRGYIHISSQGPSFPSILMGDAIDGKHSCTRWYGQYRIFPYRVLCISIRAEHSFFKCILGKI